MGDEDTVVLTPEEKDKIGITTGLAWTEVGGELLMIEVTTMPGKYAIKHGWQGDEEPVFEARYFLMAP